MTTLRNRVTCQDKKTKDDIDDPTSEKSEDEDYEEEITDEESSTRRGGVRVSRLLTALLIVGVIASSVTLKRGVTISSVGIHLSFPWQTSFEFTSNADESSLECQEKMNVRARRVKEACQYLITMRSILL